MSSTPAWSIVSAAASMGQVGDQNSKANKQKSLNCLPLSMVTVKYTAFGMRVLWGVTDRYFPGGLVQE